MFPAWRGSSQEVALHSTRPAAREELLVILVRRKFSFEHEIVSGRGEASTRLDAGFPRVTVKPGLVNDLSLSLFRIFFADAKTLEHRLANLEINRLDVYQSGVLQVGSAAGDGIDCLVGRAVTRDDALQRGGPKLSCFRRRALGWFEGPERAVSRVRRSHREIDKTFTSKKAQRCRPRRRPRDRPVAGGNSQAHFVAHGKCVCDIVHRNRYQVALTRRHGFRMLVAVAVRKVEQAIGHPGGRAVGSDVVQAHGDKGHALVGGNLQGRHWGAQNFHSLWQSLRVECQRTTVVTALVRWRFTGRAKTAPFARAEAGSLRRA